MQIFRKKEQPRITPEQVDAATAVVDPSLPEKTMLDSIVRGKQVGFVWVGDTIFITASKPEELLGKMYSRNVRNKAYSILLSGRFAIDASGNIKFQYSNNDSKPDHYPRNVVIQDKIIHLLRNKGIEAKD